MSKADGVFQRNRYDAEGLRAEMEENGRLCRFIFHQGEIVAEERDGVAAVSRYLRGHGVEYLEQEGERFSFQKDEQSSTAVLRTEFCTPDSSMMEWQSSIICGQGITTR